jgi:hypothetical protein
MRGSVPGWSKRVSGTREKFSVLRWQGSEEVRRRMYSSILSGRTGKKGWEWTKRRVPSCLGISILLVYRQMYHTHRFRTLTQSLLPSTNLLEHPFLIVAEFFWLHAILVLVSQQPRDLLAAARREWVGKELHSLLTGEQTFE